MQKSAARRQFSVASDHAYRRCMRALAALTDLELDPLVVREPVGLVVLDLRVVQRTVPCRRRRV